MDDNDTNSKEDYDEKMMVTESENIETEGAEKAEINKSEDESENDNENDNEKDESKKKKDLKKDNSDNDSEDENKLEKNYNEKSFELSSDEEDEDELENDSTKENEAENIENDDDANYLEDLMNKKEQSNDEGEQKIDQKLNDGDEKKGKNGDELMGKKSSTNSDAKLKTENQKKKSQGTDNSSKELARKRKLEQLEEENKRMQVLMANFNEEQLNRYEVFRRSAFPKTTVKKIIQTVSNKNITPSVVIAMSGIAKVFIGEIVEKALDVKKKWGDTGPLQPKHLREAFRLLKNSSKISTSLKTKSTPMII